MIVVAFFGLLFGAYVLFNFVSVGLSFVDYVGSKKRSTVLKIIGGVLLFVVLFPLIVNNFFE